MTLLMISVSLKLTRIFDGFTFFKKENSSTVHRIYKPNHPQINQGMLNSSRREASDYQTQHTLTLATLLICSVCPSTQVVPL